MTCDGSRWGINVGGIMRNELNPLLPFSLGGWLVHFDYDFAMLLGVRPRENGTSLFSPENWHWTSRSVWFGVWWKRAAEQFTHPTTSTISKLQMDPVSVVWNSNFLSEKVAYSVPNRMSATNWFGEGSNHWLPLFPTLMLKFLSLNPNFWSSTPRF